MVEWSRIERRIAFEPNSGCWIWEGASSTRGYGYIAVIGSKRRLLVHRLSYERHKGAIPPHLELDHKCRVPCCCNPDHLEPVTHLVNMRRGSRATKTHCIRGHEFTEENTLVIYRRGGRERMCRACHLGRYHAGKRR